MALVFAPTYGEGIEVTTSTSSSSTAFTANKGNVLKITNTGVTAGVVYAVVGVGTQTAVDTEELPIAGGETVYVSITESDNNLGLIASAATPVVSAIPGYVRGA